MQPASERPNPDCQRALGWLEPFLDGELGSSRREFVQSHLRQCPRCRHTFEAMQLSGQLLGEHLMAVAEEADFSGFADRVLSATRQDRPLPWSERLRTWWSESLAYNRSVWVATIATAVALLLLLLPWLGHRSDQPPVPGQVELAQAENQVIIDSMDYRGDRSMIFTVSKNNTTVIWMVDFDQADTQDSGQPDPGEEL